MEVSITLFAVLSAVTMTSSKYSLPASSSATAENDLTTVYAKLNVPLGGTYLKVGMSQVDVTSNENGGSGNTYGNASTDGLTAGLGYDHEVDNGLSVRLEVTVTEFDDVFVDNGQTNKTKMPQKQKLISLIAIKIDS